ncbi:MAG: hypothetical protein JWQ20_1376 [Conexibacter sp.]|nr:hypothetical protein [Conexibacter sp.]
MGAPGPVLLVVGVCVATWLSFAVAPADAALFLGYALAFNVLPGCAAFVATARPARLGVRELAVGWGLGYALEAGAFVLTAATGHRDLLPLYPVAVLVLAAPGLWTLRHRFAVRRPAVAPAWTWGAAGVAVAAVLLTADGFFTQAPMPSSAPAVDYYPDVMAHLGFAAEALHHWPIEVPGLAGVRLHYYFLANTHMAAISQVTGIELPAVGLRLYLVPMLVLVPVQLVALARAVGATAWTGVVAGALVLLLGSTDPLPTVPTQLLATFPLSPSFLMGTIVWLPILILLCEALDRRPEAVRLPALVLVGVPLLIVCEGAKATSLPLTVCALALVAVWAVRRDRSRLPLIVGVGAACCAVIVLFNVVLYHGMTNSLGLHPLGGYLRSEPFRLLDDRLHHSPLARVALYPLAFVLGTLRLLIALLPGLLLLGLRGGLLRRPSRVLLLGAFLTGVGAMLLLTHPGESQLYFFYPGYIAGAVLSSAGLVAVLGPMVARIQVARTWVLAGAALAALVLIIDMPVWDQTQKKSWSTLDGGVTYPHANANMTPQLYAGYRWIRDHTDTDDVLAVSNLFADQRHSDPRYCEPPAFAERRTLVSCPSDGTSEYYGRLKGDTERFVLTQAIFANADRDALRFAVQKYGVRWLVADRIHTQVNPKVSELGRIAYKNSQITVIAVPRS